MDEETFKSVVCEYTELAQEIAKMQAELRPLRKDLGGIRQKLLEYMQTQDIVECKSFQDGWVVVRRETCRTEPLKPEHILEELMSLTSPQRAEAILQNINDRRKVLKNERLVQTVKKNL